MKTKKEIEHQIEVLKGRIAKGIEPDLFREQVRALLWVLS